MITIEVLNKKWEPGKVIMKEASRQEIARFEDYIAREFVRLVKERVDKQLYKSKWAPLSQAYLEYKRKNGLSVKTWEATKELIQNLKVKSNRVVGFDKRKRHKTSGEPYLAIARRLEYGDHRIPARPLFRFVLMDMSKHMNRHYKRFKEVYDESKEV